MGGESEGGGLLALPDAAGVALEGSLDSMVVVDTESVMYAPEELVILKWLERDGRAVGVDVVTVLI